MTIKEMFGHRIGIGKIKLSHKTTSMLCGMMAYILIIQGSINILIHPLDSVLRIFYAFFLLLPISYYNMREHEKET